jgi:hypothetical protein
MKYSDFTSRLCCILETMIVPTEFLKPIYAGFYKGYSEYEILMQKEWADHDPPLQKDAL